jgi:ribosome silencing factor RsfS/YbeB/iojap
MAAKKKPTKPAAKKKPAPKNAPAKKAAAKKAAAKSASRPAVKAAARKPSRRAPPRSKQRMAKRPAPRAKPKVAKPRVAKPALPEAPEALSLARTIAGVAVEKKAADVMIIDTRARAPSVGYDYVVLASGESDRQLAAIHEGVDELLKPKGKRAASVEASPDWVCVTWDDGVVAHLFTPDRRELMDLEGLWRDAPRVAL